MVRKAGDTQARMSALKAIQNGDTSPGNIRTVDQTGGFPKQNNPSGLPAITVVYTPSSFAIGASHIQNSSAANRGKVKPYK